jgi:hypothetical protein
VRPGEYTVKLTVNGKSYTQPLTVRMDPRVKTPADGLEQQYALSMQCYDGMRQARDAQRQIRALRDQLQALRGKAGPLADAVAALDEKAAALTGAERGFRGRRDPGPREESLGRLAGELGGLLALLQGADAAPTTQAVAAVGDVRAGLDKVLKRWAEMKDGEVTKLNEKLRGANLPPLTVLSPEGAVGNSPGR